MLRVLTLSTLFPDASRPNLGRFVERQTQALAALDGVEVKVAAPIGLPPWPLSLAERYRGLRCLPERERRGGPDVLRPRFKTRPSTGGRFNAVSLERALTSVLARLRAEFRFDVIDAEFFYPDGPAAVALGRKFGVPVSIKARGSDIHHWGEAPTTRDQVLTAAHEADGLLAVSQALADDMIALGMPGPRVHRTGVDQALFAPVDRKTTKATLGITGPLVVSAGTLNANKGHDVVIDAASSLPGVNLWIAGEGPDRAALERRITASGARDRIRLLGNLPQEELARLCAAADVFALASKAEGLANVWVEALACGTPIIVTDAGGAREVVTAANGRIVAREAAAFAAAIGDLLSAPLDPAAVRATVADYTWEANALALREHLAGLANDGQRSG